jgi:predicted nucleotidyltransferase
MLNRLRDVFKSLQRHDVKYVVIGGVAAILHGVPRATFDVDILIEATPDNSKRLLDALLDAGLGSASLTTAEDILANEITVFKDRVRVDVQTTTPGIQFADAWQRRKTITYQGQEFFILSRQDLIASKRAAGRSVDMEDVRLLELPQSGGGQEDSATLS